MEYQAEQPVYIQAQLALNRVKEWAPDPSEWKTTDRYERALTGSPEDLTTIVKTGGRLTVMRLLPNFHLA